MEKVHVVSQGDQARIMVKRGGAAEVNLCFTLDVDRRRP
jgi:hypothetical protein